MAQNDRNITAGVWWGYWSIPVTNEAIIFQCAENSDFQNLVPGLYSFLIVLQICAERLFKTSNPNWDFTLGKKLRYCSILHCDIGPLPDISAGFLLLLAYLFYCEKMTCYFWELKALQAVPETCRWCCTPFVSDWGQQNHRILDKALRLISY